MTIVKILLLNYKCNRKFNLPFISTTTECFKLDETSSAFKDLTFQLNNKIKIVKIY